MGPQEAVEMPPAPLPEPGPGPLLRDRLGRRSVVLVGLMGAGKTTVGRRLAARVGLPFRDADAEIEAAAGMTVPDIFATFGEPSFRDGERRVIARLLAGPPLVLATGGGAYMDPETRTAIAQHAISVWLKVDHHTLMRRVRRRSNRPLLLTPDPDETMRQLMAIRHPVYALADVLVESGDWAHDRVVEEVVKMLDAKLANEAVSA
jgi:shikimate kinase